MRRFFKIKLALFILKRKSPILVNDDLLELKIKEFFFDTKTQHRAFSLYKTKNTQILTRILNLLLILNIMPLGLIQLTKISIVTYHKYFRKTKLQPSTLP